MPPSMLSSISDPAVQAALDSAGKGTLFPSPDDWRDHWIYFLLIDRFNNPSKPPCHRPYDAEFSAFQGGTFRGVQEKLPYLKEMGVGALWLSPVLKNRTDDPHSYHGYGVQNFLEIEPRLAANPDRAEEELKELIDAAHSHGIYVILDIVLHHAGSVFAYVVDGENREELDWQEEVREIKWHADGLLPEELHRDEFFTRRGAAESTEHGFHPAGDFSSLKAFDADYTDTGGHRPVWDILIQAHKYLIAQFDVDGFRIDTLKFLSPEFARTFGIEIRKFARSTGKHNFFLFGEIYDSEETIARFIGRDPASKAGKDAAVGIGSVVDYPLFYVLPKVAKAMPGAVPADIAQVYAKRAAVLAAANNDAQADCFVTFLDNHDQDRRFGDMGRRQMPGQIELGLALLFTLQGIPCVYYGTEQGLRGHKTKSRMDDSLVREALWGKRGAFNPSARLYRTVAALSALRRDHPALRCGAQFFRPISGDGVHFDLSRTPGGVLTYSRLLERDEVLMAANTSPVDTFSGEVVIDWERSKNGAAWQTLWSNQADAPQPGSVAERKAALPLRVLPLTLRPGEVQILTPRR